MKIMKRIRMPESELVLFAPRMSIDYTRSVGSVFVARDAYGNYVDLKVVKANRCEGCWYDANSRRCGGNYRECGFCGEQFRSDGKSVQFVAERGGAR